ncbi:MAG: hypothetical protein ACD_79C01091G0002 [uncultured bacterium]|nr:MAG: hypothetical protein ACD_79C01091G0002 [uncultured bacterium]
MQNIKNKAGLSLVEILVAVFIFSIVFLATLEALKYSSFLVSSQEQTAIANSILTEVAEDILLLDYASVNVGNMSANYNSGGSKEPDKLKDLNDSSITVSVSDADSDVGTNLKKIIITVTWTGPYGKASSPKSATIYRSRPK